MPGAPTGLSATASDTTQINLTWTAPASDGGSAITGYKIEVSSNGGSSWSDRVANTRITTTTYSHTGLSAGDTRHYRVSAINTHGTGTPSNVDDATTADFFVPADWGLIPTGLTAGDQFRLLFLSFSGRDGSSTEIADYNTFVQTHAAAGHTDIQDYSTGFRAVGCTSTVDARDNTGTTYTASYKGVPIYWLGGTKLADDYEDFYDGDWDDESNDKNESGTDAHEIDPIRPITGCDHDGTEKFTSDNKSQAYGAPGGEGVTIGFLRSPAAANGPIGSSFVADPTTDRTIYGLSAVFQVPAAVVINSPPAFSAATAARSLAENTIAGQDVGAALTAIDAESHTLTYTLEGIDAAAFDIVTAASSAQIRTKTGVTYNHEAKSSYTVIVKADDGNGGTDTITVMITLTDVDEPPGRPAAPSVTATAGSSTSLDVTWTAPENTGPAITSYDLQYRQGSSGAFTVGPQDVTGTSAVIGSLAPGTSHQVQVRATNADGDGYWSFSGTGQTGTSVPGAPTSLSATASGSTQINLSWTAPASDGGSSITGYKIEVSSDGGSSWSDHVADTTSATTTYPHTGLSAGTTRHYRVSAINTNGAGRPSNVDGTTAGTTVPGAPTGLSARVRRGTRISLRWTTPASDGGSPITGYRIEVSSNGGSSWTNLVADTTSANITYSDTGLPGGTTRHYRVSAINTNGAGTPSNVDDATTASSVPGAPTSLSAKASGSTQINLTWTAPASDGGFAITAYRIEVSSDGGSSWSDHVARTISTTATYSHTGLAPGTTRHYRVSAINTHGAGLPSNVDDATTETTVPGASACAASTASSVAPSVAVSPRSAACSVAPTNAPLSTSTACSALCAKCVVPSFIFATRASGSVGDSHSWLDSVLPFRLRSNAANSANVGVGTPEATASPSTNSRYACLLSLRCKVRNAAFANSIVASTATVRPLARPASRSRSSTHPNTCSCVSRLIRRRVREHKHRCETVRPPRIGPDTPDPCARFAVLDASLLRRVPDLPAPLVSQLVSHECDHVLECDPRLLEAGRHKDRLTPRDHQRPVQRRSRDPAKQRRLAVGASD